MEPFQGNRHYNILLVMVKIKKKSIYIIKADG